MERRLQILLDADRYDRVSAEAERSGRSVAAVIREAIDFRFPEHGDRERARAAVQLLAMTEEPDSGPPMDPADYKAAYDDHLIEKLP